MKQIKKPRKPRKEKIYPKKPFKFVRPRINMSFYALMIILVVYIVSNIRYNIGNYQLSKNRKTTVGVVDEVTYYKGSKKTHYSFYVGSEKYKGCCYYDVKKYEGDTLKIIYLPTNPKINRCITFSTN